MRILSIFILVSLGCGRLHFDYFASSDAGSTDGSQVDASSDAGSDVGLDGATLDGAADAAKPLNCGTFGMVESVAGIFTATAQPAISRDGMRIFMSEFNGISESDLQGATVSNSRVVLSGASISAPDSPDDVTLYYTTGTDVNDWQIAVATRVAIGQDFSPQGTLSIQGWDPTATADDLELYFATLRSGQGDIWSVKRESRADPWGSPSLVANINSDTSLDGAPAVSSDGLELLFVSLRSGAGDLYRSIRSSRTADFGVPTPVAELNSSETEEDPTLSADSQSIIFKQSGYFYRATRTCTPSQ